MKRLLKSVTSLSIILLLFGSTSYAETAATLDTDAVVIFETAPITDIDVLFERARNGITDATAPTLNQSMTLSSKSLNVPVKEADEEVDVEYYSTSQKVKAVQQGEDVTESYITTSFSVLTAGSKYETTPDQSLGVVAYSTINYDRTTNGNLYNYKLISVTGGWNPHDSTISLSNRIVRYGITGNKSGGGFVNNQSGNVAVSVNAYGFTAPTSWGTVETSFMTMGSNSSVTLTRGSSQWVLNHFNNISH